MLAKFLETATAVLTWLLTALTSVTEIFYAEGEFTFIGICSIIVFVLGISTMVVAMVRQFVHGRG